MYAEPTWKSCCITLGAVIGNLVDWNPKRHCGQQGYHIHFSRGMGTGTFISALARTLYCYAVGVKPYKTGWNFPLVASIKTSVIIDAPADCFSK
jgi:hypothetical protein